MNPDRDKPRYWMLRKSHLDDISEERLTEIIAMLQRVAHNTGATLNQTISVYDAASRNRLTEVLLDSGDAFDRVVSDFHSWKKSDGYLYVKLSGDDLADEVRVQIEEKDN